MKIFGFLLICLCSISAFGQTSDYGLIPIQAGTANLTSGKTIITLNENTLSALAPENGGETYYVELTPIGNCGILKLAEKNNKSFTVAMAGNGAESGNFDYIVFVRYHLIPVNRNMEPPSKILPAQNK